MGSNGMIYDLCSRYYIYQKHVSVFESQKQVTDNQMDLKNLYNMNFS